MALEIPQIYKPVRLGTQINWGHPLSRGLVCAVGAHGIDAVQQQPVLSSNLIEAGTSQSGWGVGANATQVVSTSYNKSIDDAMVAGEWSLVTCIYLVQQPASNTFPSTRVGYFASSTDTENYGFQLNGNDNDLIFYAQRGSTSINYHQLDSNVTYPHFSVLGATWTSTTAATVYRNGRRLGSYASSPAVADTRVRVLVSHSHTLNRWQAQYVYVYNRRLTDSEHAWLAKEPYAFWKQEQPRRFVAYQSTAVTGTGSFTTAAAALAGTGDQTYAGTGSITSAAASLAGTAALIFEGTASFTGAAASLDISGILAYNGTAAFESAPAEIAGSGSLSYAGTASLTTAAASLAGSGQVATGTITGTAHVTSAAASFQARGRRRLKAGHNVVDLARYDAFVSQGEAILEELGQTPQPTGAKPVELAIEPIHPIVARPTPQLQIPTPQLVVVPDIPALKGKRWIRGTGAWETPPSAVSGSATLRFTGQAVQWPADGVALAATGTIDNYYSIRQQDEALIEDFIRTHLLGTAV